MELAIDIKRAYGVSGAKASTLAMMVSGEPTSVFELMSGVAFVGAIDRCCWRQAGGGADAEANKQFALCCSDCRHLSSHNDAIKKGEELGVPRCARQAVRLVTKHGVFQRRAQQHLSRIVEINKDRTQA
jgi:hypothetical protein